MISVGLFWVIIIFRFKKKNLNTCLSLRPGDSGGDKDALLEFFLFVLQLPNVFFLTSAEVGNGDIFSLDTGLPLGKAPSAGLPISTPIWPVSCDRTSLAPFSVSEEWPLKNLPSLRKPFFFFSIGTRLVLYSPGTPTDRWLMRNQSKCGYWSSNWQKQRRTFTCRQRIRFYTWSQEVTGKQ